MYTWGRVPNIMNWRLIRDGKYSGAWNMARDEALLFAQDESTLPVLRFYNWKPTCISLGRLQKKFDFSRLVTSSFDVVRRPTGGRAVLHEHEITYCAVIHESQLPRESRTVIGAYHWLSAGFIEGLKNLGVQAQLSSLRSRRTSLENCFQSSAQCDFLVDGRKLIGAAQCRKDGAILQHGAILLKIDHDAWEHAIGGSMESVASLQSLGITQTPEEIIAALIDGMAHVGGISFRDSQLSKRELDVASCLHTHKYSQDEWNRAGKVPPSSRKCA